MRTIVQILEAYLLLSHERMIHRTLVQVGLIILLLVGLGTWTIALDPA